MDFNFHRTRWPVWNRIQFCINSILHFNRKRICWTSLLLHNLVANIRSLLRTKVTRERKKTHTQIHKQTAFCQRIPGHMDMHKGQSWLNLCCTKISITCEFHFHASELIEIVHVKRSFPFNIVPSEVEKLVWFSCYFVKAEKEKKDTQRKLVLIIINNVQHTALLNRVCRNIYYECQEHSDALE